MLSNAQVTIEEAGSHDSNAAHEASQREADRGANVVDAAHNALRAVAAALPWPQYEQLLSQALRAMKVGVLIIIILTQLISATGI